MPPTTLEELARCNKDPQLHYGLKLHFGNSDVDLNNPDDVEKVKKVFKAANGVELRVIATNIPPYMRDFGKR